MRRGRKLAIALLAAAVVVAAVYATGAFTSTTASRSADVRVAGDGAAFLSLQPSSGPNGEYASYGPNGALQVKMGKATGSSGATGVNPDSQTEFENVFTITNKGAQPVSIWFTGGSPAVTFMHSGGTPIEGRGSAVTLRPGGKSLHVGLTIDARGVNPGTDLLESVEIRTDADVLGVSAPAAAQSDSDGSASRTSTESTGSGPTLPISGGVPGSLGDSRLYSVGSPVGQPGDSEQGFVETIARRLVPFGRLGSVFTDHKDCSDGSTETTQSAPTVPEGPTTPSTETPESTTTEETVPPHATRPACEDRNENTNIDIDTDDPVTMAFAGVVVIFPEGFLGPTDEAAGLAAAAGTIGALLAADEGTTTVEKEENGNDQANEQNEKSRDEQQNEGGSDGGGRRYPKPPRLIPDGGDEDHPPGYEALREQGVPEDTIEDWHEKGYNLRQMSDALATYRDSGETLTSDEPAGELGEILAKSEVKETFPSSVGLKSNIKLDGGNTGEFDYVVLNADDEVIGVVEVKHTDDDASFAENRLKANMKALNEGRVDSVSGTLTTENFNVSHEIKRVTIGPSSDKQRVQEDIQERNLPEDSVTGYDEHIDLGENEIKDLSKMIDEQ